MTAKHFALSVVTPAQILEGVSAIALQIQQAVALETILQTALDATRELLHSDRVLLYRFLPDRAGIIAAEAVGTEWTALLGQVIDDPCFDAAQAERYRKGYFSAIEDVASNGVQGNTALLTRLQVRANLAVPLLAQGDVWGLLIAHHCQSTRVWHPLEVQCLQLIAMQLGVAIQLEARQQEQLVGAIATNLPGAIYRAVYSPEGNLSSLFLSEHYRTLLGYEPQALMAQPERVLELIYPDDRARFFEALKAATETLDASYLEYRFITASGEAVWVRDDARFSRSDHGELVVDGMHLDITDRKRSEDALRESEARKSALISALPDLVMRADKHGIYLEFLATTTFKVIGDTGDFVGMHVSDSLPHKLAQRRMAAISTALETQAIQFYEQTILVAGVPQTEEVRVVPYRADEVLLLVRDITDRKQAEAALYQREQEFKALAENAPDIVCRFDRHLRYLYVNPAVKRASGLAPQKFIGQTCQELGMSDDFRAQWEPAIVRVFATGQQEQIDCEFSSPHGVRFYQARCVPEFAAAGTVVSVLSVARDITEQKQAESALRQWAQREQALNRVLQAIRQSLDLHTILTTAATEVAQLLNVDQASVVQYLPECQCWLHVAAYRQSPALPDDLGLEIPDEGNPFAAQLKRREIVKVADTAAIEDDIQKLARTMPGAWLLVPIIVGDTVWGSFTLRSSQTITHWQNEQVELVQALADQLAIAIQQAALYQQVQTLNTDLELQVQERTAQLQQSLNFEALLKRITDHVRDSLDETQILQTAVQELAIELGVDCCDTALYDMERRTSTICYEYIHPRVSATMGVVIPFEQNPDLYRQTIRGQTVHCCVTPLVKQIHRNIEQSASVLVCPLMDERGVLGDMWLFKPPQSHFEELEIRLVKQVANQCAIALRQSRLYQAAQAQVQELERLNQLKDDFLSTVSHELRTPMANIKMATQMLEITLKPLGVFDDEAGQINRYFNILREEGQREIGLINDLLDLARLDAGMEPLRLNTIALQFFLPHLAEPFLERTRKQQQQLVIDVPETLPSLTTDLPYLERILTELLQNACKYTPTGETITLAAQATSTALEIYVSNSGIEIPAIECDRIFDKFYRIPNNDPWKHGGTGLGLTLVKKLAERLGASIHVVSRGKTTFTLKFPSSV